MGWTHEHCFFVILWYSFVQVLWARTSSPMLIYIDKQRNEMRVEPYLYFINGKCYRFEVHECRIRCTETESKQHLLPTSNTYIIDRNTVVDQINKLTGVAHAYYTGNNTILVVMQRETSTSGCIVDYWREIEDEVIRLVQESLGSVDLPTTGPHPRLNKDDAVVPEISARDVARFDEVFNNS